MSALSFALAILSMFLTLVSMVSVGVEWFGLAAAVAAIFSAIGGIVTGAVAHGRAKQEGADTTFAVVSIVTNVFVFLGSFCLGGCCGGFNYLISSEGLTRTEYVPGPDGGVVIRRHLPDGAVIDEEAPRGMFGPSRRPSAFFDVDAGTTPAADPTVAPTPIAPADPMAPPPAYPPPPIDPGRP